jgi:glycosyltransferase involved in cell wall biosynthesis
MNTLAIRRIIAVIPAKNEAYSIGSIVDKVSKYVSGVTVIDGHSTDSTFANAQSAGARVVIQKESGKGSALKQAFMQVHGDAVVILDADGSMRPEEIPIFKKILDDNPEVDIVKGSRFCGHGYSEDMGTLRRIGNLIFVLLVNLFWSTEYTDLCYGFGAFKTSAMEKLFPLLESNNFDIETEIAIKAKKLGLKVVEVPSVELKREHGQSNLNTFRDGAEILLRIFKELIFR